MNNYERIKDMDIDKLACFLESYRRGGNIEVKADSLLKKDLVLHVKKWLLCHNKTPSLEEFNSIKLEES